jgi:hypothetical protein
MTWRTIPSAIGFPPSREPAQHVVAFEKGLPLGFARCLRCGQSIRLSERLQECPGKTAA